MKIINIKGGLCMSIFDCKVCMRNDELCDLSSMKGKVLLIVNTATGCGFTPQYKGA